jgi:3,4-dihydroxy 2-butanone 4-phosphate synthase/GTP cyclohydrolase II
MFNTIEEGLAAFKSGNPILLIDDESRENEGDIIFPADAATQEKLNLCATHAKGLVCIAIDTKIAKRLNLSPVASNHMDPFHTAFYDSIDANPNFGITTGISAKERAITAGHIANPNSKPNDFIKPGHLFPVVAKTNGVLVRQGHTEAAVDLCKLTGHEPAAIICEVMDNEGNMMRREGLFQFATKFDLKVINIQQIITEMKQKIICFSFLSLHCQPLLETLILKCMKIF